MLLFLPVVEEMLHSLSFLTPSIVGLCFVLVVLPCADVTALVAVDDVAALVDGADVAAGNVAVLDVLTVAGVVGMLDPRSVLILKTKMTT